MQDEEILAGEEWPLPRFSDPVNGTVRDNLTGLIWTEDTNTPGPLACIPGAGKYSFDAYPFIQCLNNNNYLGSSDWRPGVSWHGSKCLGVFYSGEAITVIAESSTDSIFNGWTRCPSPEEMNTPLLWMRILH